MRKSYELELLDQPDIPAKDIELNMQELNTINTLLGGHAITQKGFKQLVGSAKKISVCEIGCGGGDNLFAIYTFCKKHNIEVQLTGIDINENALKFAKEKYRDLNAEWLCGDYQKFAGPYDIVFNSLFCHHFKDEALFEIAEWMKKNSRIGYFINDLHRNIIAYYSIKILTRIFSKSYLVKNDAPLSVSRGFTKQELQNFFREATVKWQWAFRFLVIYKHKNA
jgi:2-polyprenyl-3-methyl-5-hydroxy-6-metoxy-1,4-benzoquinol methylase